MRRAAAALLLLISACAKKGTAVYQEPGGSFSCAAPADWRVLEDGGSATFLGPASGPRPYAASISAYYYPKSSEHASPEAYRKSLAAAVKTTELKTRAWKGQNAWEFTSTRTAPAVHGAQSEPRQELTVLLPAQDGFYALVHAAPQSQPSLGAKEFADVLESFRPAR